MFVSSGIQTCFPSPPDNRSEKEIIVMGKTDLAKIIKDTFEIRFLLLMNTASADFCVGPK